MARTKLKADRWAVHREALVIKQREMVDAFERDRAHGNEQNDDGIQDLADKAASTYSKELNFSLSDADRSMLVHIEDALERINNNEYGVCDNCGVVIGEKRLNAIPWTPYCIDCQELQEKGMLN